MSFGVFQNKLFTESTARTFCFRLFVEAQGKDSETAFCLDYFSVFDSFTVHPSCLQRWHLSAVCPVGEDTARNHANNIKSGCVKTFLYKNTNKKQDFTLSVDIFYIFYCFRPRPRLNTAVKNDEGGDRADLLILHNPSHNTKGPYTQTHAHTHTL